MTTRRETTPGFGRLVRNHFALGVLLPVLLVSVHDLYVSYQRDEEIRIESNSHETDMLAFIARRR